MRRFQPGETVVRREIMLGEVWFGYASICVEDSDAVFATYLPPDARFGFPPTSYDPHPWWDAGHRSWQGHGILALHWPGVDHAIFVFWEGAERRFAGWYFNLQDAPRRTPIGFDTLDHELDIVWPAGASTWEWKDQDKFALTGHARYPGRVERIQAEGERVGRLLDAGERWWDEPWADWAPPDHWKVPELPAGWAELPFELPTSPKTSDQ